MRVLFASIRNPSHFIPLVPFIDACRGAGHEVAVAAPQDLAERAAKVGAAFFALGHPGDEGLRPVWERMRAVTGPESNGFVVREIFAGMCASFALPAMLDTLRAWKPDVVVRESQEYASLLAAGELRIPHLRVGITTQAAEAALTHTALPALELRRSEQGFAPDPAGDQMLRETVLTQFPESFDPSAGAARVLRFRAPKGEVHPLPAYWGDDTRPLVYVTLGTVIGTMGDMQAAYRVALDAVSTLPVRVLLTIGNALPLEALGEVPSNVHVERFIPQDDVFPHAAAVVNHGGSGTVIGTLAAGVPMVVTPMFADQPANAARAAEAGVGLALAPRNTDPGALRDALSKVLATDSFRKRAGQVAAEIAALPAMSEAARALEQIAAQPA